MKKCFPILLVLVILSLILQVVVNIFVKEKATNYVIKKDDLKYTIDETLTVVDDESYYDFVVESSNDLVYTFSFNNDFNKQTEIIRDVEFISTDNLKCIFPIYKKDLYGDVYCLYNGQQVSSSYLKQINSYDFAMVTNKLDSLGYTNDNWKSSSNKTERLESNGRGIDFYQENIFDNYTFLMWRYKGLYILKSDDAQIKEFLEYDQYENKLSMLVGKYYVTVDYQNSPSVSEFLYYNTKEYGKGEIRLPNTTSDDYYFNGVYKEKLYMTDIKERIQYEINPAYEKVVEVGNDEIGFKKMENGELVNVSADEFLKEKIYFGDGESNEEIKKTYGDIETVKSRSFYYFKTSDGKLYRVHEEKISNPELLFKLDNFTEWKVKNGDVLAVSGDKMYFYTDEKGLLPIAVNSELKYNHYNICDFWKK